MTLEEFTFTEPFKIPSLYLIIDKKERTGYQMAGGVFTTPLSVGNNTIPNTNGFIQGKTQNNYIFIIKNIITQKIYEKIVDVDLYYSKQINDFVLFKNDFDFITQITSVKYLPSVWSELLVKSLIKTLSIKEKDLFYYTNENIKLNKHPIWHAYEIQKVQEAISDIELSILEIKTALVLLRDFASEQIKQLEAKEK